MEPVTLALGAAAAWLLLGGSKPATSTPAPAPPKDDPCSPEKVEAVVVGAVQGGVQGASVGGAYGAGAGAALPVLTSRSSLACGQKKINEAKARLCKKADAVAHKLEARFGSSVVPKRWDKFSCDEKIAWVAALGPLGTSALLAGTLAGAGWDVTRKTVEGWAQDAESAAKKVGDALEDAGGAVGGLVKSAGKVFRL